MSAARFTVWLQHHCPRLLEGVQQWLLYLLHGHALTQGAAQEEVLTHVAVMLCVKRSTGCKLCVHKTSPFPPPP